jgi:hypothetical protein
MTVFVEKMEGSPRFKPVCALGSEELRSIRTGPTSGWCGVDTRTSPSSPMSRQDRVGNLRAGMIARSSPTERSTAIWVKFQLVTVTRFVHVRWSRSDAPRSLGRSYHDHRQQRRIRGRGQNFART